MFLIVLGVSMLNAGGHTYAIDNETQFQTTRALLAATPRLDHVSRVWAARADGPYRPHPDGGFVGVVGLGQSIASLPLHALAAAAARALPVEQRDALVRTAAFFTNAVLLAATAAMVVVAAGLFTGSARGALLLGAAYGLGTYALPHAKTFFTEIGTALFVSIGVWAAMAFARVDDHRQAILAGAASGVALWFRISAGLFLPLVGSAVVLGASLRRAGGDLGSARARILAGARGGAWFVAGAAIPLLLLGLANWWRFGSPLDPGYRSVPQTFPLWSGLRGALLSPGKSLFLFAPLTLLALPGLAVALRRGRFEILLPAAVVAANLLFFSRVPYWHGDHAWGPRYQQIVLPCAAILAAPLLDGRAWRRVLAGLFAVGLVLPAALGSLVHFNAHFFEAARALGRPPGGEIRERLRWQPMLGHLRLLPDAIADVTGVPPAVARPPRPPYSDDPDTHYAFFAARPRIDLWWLWVGPMRASPLTYAFLAPAIACLVVGSRQLRRRLRALPA